MPRTKSSSKRISPPASAGLNRLRPNLSKQISTSQSRPTLLAKTVTVFQQVLIETLENRRLLIAQPFALIAGILLYSSARYEPSLIAIAVLGIFLVGALYVWRNYPLTAATILLALGMFVGASAASVHAHLFGTEMVYGAFYGDYSARVDAIHSQNSERTRIIISNIIPMGDDRTPPIRRARIVVPLDQAPSVGDIIHAPMRLYRVPGPIVPGGFDPQFHAYFDGIGAYGSTTGQVSLLKPAEQVNFWRWIEDVRQAIGARIDDNLPLPLSGIARALIIGDQGQINDDVRQDLAEAGLAHVLAISGLHLSLVAGGIFAAIRMVLASSYVLGQWVSVKKIAALGGMSAALIYLGLSGASVSAIRATLMLMLIFGAVLAGRRALTMRNVAFAALVVIVIDPASIFRPSFQLSFAAVTALVGVYEGYRLPINEKQSGFRKTLSSIVGIGLTSLIAGAATALFAAYHFQQVAPFGVLGNIFAIPLVAFVILPAALIAVILMPFGFEGLFLSIMGWGISQILTLASAIANMSTDVVTAPILGPTALLLGLLGFAWFAVFTGKIRVIGVVFGIVLIPLFGVLPRPDIMIADTTLAIALKGEADLGEQSAGGQYMELISGRNNSFAVNVWSETYMIPIITTIDKTNCDLSGCFYVRADYKIAVVKTHDAFEEDCSISNLVITRIIATENCRNQTQVIDKNDLQTGGVHWAKWDGDNFVIRPAITDIYRPWRPQYPNY